MESAEISAEVHFAQKLASNEKKIRDRAIKRLRKYLFARSSHGGLTESDVVKIWKGLHYCMWMQDKPLLQEELSQRISGLLQSFSSPEGALLFLKVFLETEAREWNGIDKLRLDKFMMMIRDMLHQSFTLLSNLGWSSPECRQFAEALALKVMLPGEARLPDGLKLHLADIYVDELLKVPLDKMSSRKMVLLLRPFIDFLVYTSKTELASRVMQEVINKVLNIMSTVKRCAPSSSLDGPDSRQDSDEDEMDDAEIDEEIDINEDSMDVDEENETAENTINFVMDADLLLFLLFKLAKDPKVKAKNRAMVYKLVKKYPEIYDNIVNTLTISPDGLIRAKDDLDGESGTLEDLALFHNDGQGGDHQQQQKKKKRRKNKNNGWKEEDEIQESKHPDSPVGIQPQTEPEEQSQQAKNRKKSKGGEHEKKLSKTVKRKRDIAEDEDCTNDQQRPKAMKLSSEDLGVQLTGSQPSTTEEKSRKKKKKKRKSSKEQDSTSSDTNIHPTTDTSNLSLADHEDMENAEAALKDKNSNAKSARGQSPGKSSADMFASAVEMVIYPKKSPAPKEKRKDEGSKKQRVSRVEVDENMHLKSSNSGNATQFVQRQPSRSPSPSYSSHSSLSLADSLFSAALDRKKKSSKKGRKSSSSPSPSSPGLSDDAGDCATSGDSQVISGPDTAEVPDDCPCKYAKKSESKGALGGVLGEVKSVFSSIKEKYVDPLIPSVGASQSTDNTRSESSMDWSMGANSSFAATTASPAAGDEGDEDTLSSEQLSRTDPGPDRKKVKCRLKGDKKKVVFDLRKNRANKFQDYIKSLQRQPESPHMPEKSPSNSILKPGLSPVVSPGKKQSPKSAAKKSPKKKRNQKDGSRSPSPSPGKLKTVRSRSNVKVL